MEKLFKLDQEMFEKYLPGKTIKASFKTPIKNVRAYTTTDSHAILIATKAQKSRVASVMALVATSKGWDFSLHNEGSHIICLLSP